jgi:hypothetical protein
MMLEIVPRQHAMPGALGYQYDALHGDRVLCTALDPFTAGARVLLQEGHDPGEIVALIVEGRLALLGELGKVAVLGVKNSPSGRPVFRRARDTQK